ncbi:MAG: hypothetical protein ABWZ98_00785, partial [Nakamurella sp.]
MPSAPAAGVAATDAGGGGGGGGGVLEEVVAGMLTADDEGEFSVAVVLDGAVLLTAWAVLATASNEPLAVAVEQPASALTDNSAAP